MRFRAEQEGPSAPSSKRQSTVVAVAVVAGKKPRTEHAFERRAAGAAATGLSARSSALAMCSGDSFAAAMRSNGSSSRLRFPPWLSSLLSRNSFFVAMVAISTHPESTRCTCTWLLCFPTSLGHAKLQRRKQSFDGIRLHLPAHHQIV